jgi:hypothetical protein
MPGVRSSDSSSFVALRTPRIFPCIPAVLSPESIEIFLQNSFVLLFGGSRIGIRCGRAVMKRLALENPFWFLHAVKDQEIGRADLISLRSAREQRRFSGESSFHKPAVRISVYSQKDRQGKRDRSAESFPDLISGNLTRWLSAPDRLNVQHLLFEWFTISANNYSTRPPPVSGPGFA